MGTNITLLIMTNGRKEYLERSMATIDRLHGNITRTLINDDSLEKKGFRGAMASAWEKLKEDSNDWVFHLEEDFLILEDIDLNAMIDVMTNNPDLIQIVLSRHYLPDRTIKKRGIIVPVGERFKEKTDGKNYWVENRINFSCNPCLYRKSLVYDYQWPDMDRSEHRFSQVLLKNPEIKFAYWGKLLDNPKVEHIGENRTGFNY